MINKVYTVQIDGTGKPDTFRWSDGGDFVIGVPVRIPWWSMRPLIKIRVLNTKKIWRLIIDYKWHPFYVGIYWLIDWKWCEQRQKYDYMMMKPFLQLGDKW